MKVITNKICFGEMKKAYAQNFYNNDFCSLGLSMFYVIYSHSSNFSITDHFR